MVRDLGNCLDRVVTLGTKLHALTRARMQEERYEVVPQQPDDDEHQLAARARSTAEELIRERTKLAARSEEPAPIIFKQELKDRA